jgi:hypothetical protein
MTKRRPDQPQGVSLGVMLAALMAAVTTCISSWYFITRLANK